MHTGAHMLGGYITYVSESNLDVQSKVLGSYKALLVIGTWRYINKY